MDLHAVDLRVLHRAVAGARLEALDRIDGVHAGRDAPEHRVLAVEPGAASVVTMKNWLPFVSGPRFAIASAPRATLWSLISSSNS